MDAASDLEVISKQPRRNDQPKYKPPSVSQARLHIPMTDTHVVSALKTKRIQVASQIEALQGQLRQATTDLDHVEAALRLFDPEVDLAALSPRKVAPVLYDNQGRYWQDHSGDSQNVHEAPHHGPGL
jgi:hypothetical protein